MGQHFFDASKELVQFICYLKGNALEIEGNVLNVSSEISNDLVQKSEILKTIPVFSFDLYK
jgi:hypothetical protein